MLKSNFQISKLEFRFQINFDEFSRDRSFGHKALETIRYNMIAALDHLATP